MKCNKLWYIVTLLAFALLPLAGCGGSGSPVKATEKGTEITVGGQVDTSTATAKVVGLVAGDANSVTIYNALDGAALVTGAVDADGKFSGLTFTLPSTKAILVFKAVVATGTFRSVVPIDLSNPPPAGTISGSRPINIIISPDTTTTASAVSQLLGLTGLLGDTDMTLTKAGKTYADAATYVIDNGGQQLAYSGSGLALNGKIVNAAMLPAQDSNTLAADQLNNMTLDGAITSVAIPGNRPIVSFEVKNKDTGKGIRGLKSFNLVIAQLKPAANGSPSEWLSYMVTPSAVTATALTSLPGRPSTDAATASTITVSKAGDPVVKVNIDAYKVIDNGDGSYTVIFGKDIKNAATINQGFGPTYDANLTHRIMVGIRTTPSVVLQQNGSNLSNFYNEKYFIKDFVPATPAAVPTEQRDMTTTDACNECHGKIGVTTPHGGRGDVKYCMMCHTAQRSYGRTNSASASGAFTGTTYIADGEVTGDFITMIHKIHMGKKLTKTGYNYANVLFNGITYPKDITNCRQCHRGDTTAELAIAPQGNNWKTKPSRKSCGSCHDNINFATGANLKAGGKAHAALTDDAQCAGCHGATYVEEKHMTVNATPNNPNVKAGLVNFFYEIKEATVVEDKTVTPNTSVATIKFRIQKNTGSLTATKSDVVFDGSGSNPLVGFTGGPSFLLAYYKDSPNQPAASNSADYNNLGMKAAQPITVSIANLLDGTKGTLVAGSGADAGYYVATLKSVFPPSSSASAFPVGSKLRAVGLQGYFTQVSPAAARHALSAVKEVKGDAVRRDIVDSAKCGNCHEWFEGHGGNRVVGKDTIGQSICALCHVPNLSTSGRGAQASLIDFIRTQPVSTSLVTVINLLSTATPQAGFTGTVSQGAKDAMTSLVAAFGSDPTTYPEASNNFKDMIHGVHAGNDPLVVGTPLKFVRDRGTSGDFDYNFSGVTFPGVLKNCRACHKDNPVSATNPAVDNTKATYISIPAGAQASTQVTTSGVPLVKQTAAPASVANGNNVTQVDLDRKSLPNAQDLVNSPFTATCKACHSKPSAVAHFKQMGGKILQPRSTVDANDEACVTCHGTTGPNALFNVHRFSVVGE